MQPSNDPVDKARVKLDELRVDVKATPPLAHGPAIRIGTSFVAGRRKDVEPQQGTLKVVCDDETPPTAVRHEVNPPRIFYGSRSWRKHNVYSFVDQIDAYAAPVAGYIDDEQRVRVCASYMSGTARTWYFLHLNHRGDARVEPAPAWLSDFELFKSELVAEFGVRCNYFEGRQRLVRLRQTRSAALYAANFRRMAPWAAWDDKTLRYYFVRGLNQELQDELARRHEPMNSLGDLVSTVIELDRRLYGH